jgi:hypothetical protein
MLSFEEKTEWFKSQLEIKHNNYGDEIKDEIYFYFFENKNSLDFLNSIESKSEIENKLELLVSKIIMHEHEDGLINIIYNYV